MNDLRRNTKIIILIVIALSINLVSYVVVSNKTQLKMIGIEKPVTEMIQISNDVLGDNQKPEEYFLAKKYQYLGLVRSIIHTNGYPYGTVFTLTKKEKMEEIAMLPVKTSFNYYWSDGGGESLYTIYHFKNSDDEIDAVYRKSYQYFPGERHSVYLDMEKRFLYINYIGLYTW